VAEFRPNVSHVPASDMTQFTKDVLKQLKKASVVEHDYRILHLKLDLDALAELNHAIQYDLLDSRRIFRRNDFRWYNRSLQEFFAALWLSRYADKDGIKLLRQGRYDDPREEAKKSLYEPLWGFLVEMPRAVRKNNKWLPVVRVLFEPRSPRCCEMIYRSCPALRRSKAGREVISEWQKEFQELLDTPGPQGDTAREIRDGFRPCPPDPTSGQVQFLMGSPEGEAYRRDDEFQHLVTLSPFRMHQYPVTNAQFELFDPGHKKVRWRPEPHPAGEEARNHPVADVTWFQAWCFALWAGNHLPTEAQWEYACRGGASSYQTFHVGDSLSSRDANFDWRYPYGDAEPSNDYLKCTTKVGSYVKNGFDLYDMHGNVWEWCEDWYVADFYRKGEGLDPVNRKPASFRVLRGGSWGSYGWGSRSAYRHKFGPGYSQPSQGFRLAAVPVVGAEPAASEKA